MPVQQDVLASHPPAPLLDAMVACMEEAGFEVTVDFSGGITGPEMPAEQSALWLQASDECGRVTGFSSPQLSPEQLSELYWQEVDAHACLRAQDLESQTPPSEQTYIDTWGTGDQYYAHRELFFAGLPQSSWQTISDECPPPTWFLNVEGLG